MKAQVDIVFFMVLVVVMLIIAPVMLTIFKEAVGGFTTGLNAVSNQSANEVAKMDTAFTNMYDYLVIAVFLASALMLIITSFLIGVHPIFLVFYILACIFAMIFVPNFLQATSSIWSADTISTYTSSLPLTQFILDNYTAVMLVMMVITGIVIYAKLRGQSNQY